MTRTAIIPLPASQLALARARRTIRAEHATAAEIAQACTDLETHGDWMDAENARQLRAAQRLDAPTRSAPLITAACIAALLAGAILAELHPLRLFPAPQEAADAR